MTKFIGDVHGKFGAYKTLIKNNPGTIQVGDMGVGFRNFHGDWTTNPPYDYMVANNARFIRGNHDNPGVCRRHSQCIPDGYVEGNMMFCGGAWSIDWAFRTEDYTWWRDEECSYDEFMNIMNIFEEKKPRIMVTHDCPEQVLPYILSHHTQFTTRTGQCFANMWEKHQPEIWIFGHHHKSFDMQMDGTRFICLNELELKEIE